MSNLHYHRVMRVDRENKFISIFNGNTGMYVRTGILTDMEDMDSDTGVDPFMASFPELIDIGIMERCVCSSKCNVDCYQKACDRTGNNMKIDDFKWILDQCRARVFQVALGGAGDPDTHENFAEILEYCHKQNVVPNFTTSGIALTQEKVDLCKKYCGAVAVSEHFEDYTDKAVEMLLRAGIKTNIHYVLSTKTIDKATDILRGNIDYRPGINAVVFLLYKPVGLGIAENVLKCDDKRVREFFKILDNRKCKFKVGFDSCSCSGLINYAEKYDKNSVDYCEGARFSMYIDAQLNAMPCSFANQDKSWFVKIGGDVKIKEAWNSEIFNNFRSIIKGRCNGCSDKKHCGGGCPLMKNISLCDRQEIDE